jgi:hypothetical protein
MGQSSQSQSSRYHATKHRLVRSFIQYNVTPFRSGLTVAQGDYVTVANLISLTAERQTTALLIGSGP